MRFVQRELGALERFDEFHHGDCIAADVQAAAMVGRRYPDVRVISHPGAITILRESVQWIEKPGSGIQRTTHAEAGTIHGMEINLRGAYVFVTEQILHGTNVVAAFQQVRGK